MAPRSARAQVDDLLLSLEQGDIGLGGWVRPGDWAVLRLTLENRSAKDRAVVCEWLSSDIDGDQVRARRTATLAPQRQQGLWLYAPAAVRTNERTDWKLRVSDAQSGGVLASRMVRPYRLLDRRVRAVAVMGSASLGLGPYADRPGADVNYGTVTRQEATQFLSGLRPIDLPDRWHGLAMLQAIIWTSEAGDPGDPAIGDGTREALRQWVRRGGHLVLSLVPDDPNYLTLWRQSALSDLLPDVDARTIAVRRPPAWLGQPSRLDELSLNLTSLTPVSARADSAPGDDGRLATEAPGLLAPAPRPDPDLSVLLRSEGPERGLPVVVARQYGLGRVTLIGVDLADRRLVRVGLPNSYTSDPAPIGTTLWATVFGWQGPARTDDFLDSQLRNGAIIRPGLAYRGETDLAELLPPALTTTGTIGPLLLAAILLFGLYWLLAGPVGFAVLRARGQSRHNWVVFALVVAAFTALTWGGALLLRTNTASVRHLSVIDFDARSGLVRLQSWMSVFWPTHATVELRLDGNAADPPDPAALDHTLASPGIDPRAEAAVFVDTQSYLLDARAPAWSPLRDNQRRGLRVPFRATAKQFQAHLLATPDRLLPAQWPVPQGTVTESGGRLGGQLAHRLPGDLTNVLIVWCPGDRRTPMVQRRPLWASGQTLDLADRSSPMTPLLTPPGPARGQAPTPPWTGYLAGLLKNFAGLRQPDHPTSLVIDASRQAQMIEALSFYDALPPPRYEARQGGFDPGDGDRLQRSAARSLDLSHLTALRRLIVIGHMDAAPTPMPLTLDGQRPASSGSTIVRIILPVP